ncbi:TraB/GumN family protein [Falsiroseomonas sp. E2-1-a4]|uniref:TraB/GumN family protein n=1 Tax=Falsiroseomonas sp. E2-1-a4 TaxID=3239299 RepID=UPI003F307343
MMRMGLFAFWLLLLAACGTAPPGPATVIAFRITPADRATPVSHILPGPHRPAPGYWPPDPSILDGASRFLLESRNDGRVDAAPALADPPLDPAAYLEPRHIAFLTAVTHCLGLSDTPLARLRPYYLFSRFAAISPAQLTQGACVQPMGVARRAMPARAATSPPRLPMPPPGIGGDRWLAAEARRRNISLDGVETHTEAMAIIARTPDRIWYGVWRQTLDVLADQAAAERETLLRRSREDASANHDFERLRAAALASLAADPADRIILGRYFIDERNALMAARLLPVLQRQSVVVALGSTHVAGPTGVPELLRQAGLRVERVRIPAYGAGAAARR